MSSKKLLIDLQGYTKLIEQIKADIQQAQLRAALSVTKELTLLYWRIGKQLSEVIALKRWGSKAVENVAMDITSAFPNISGFSYRNLQFMRQFAEIYPNGIYETAVSQIPWGHNILLMQKLKTEKERLWYAAEALSQGWSRSFLEECISNKVFERQGKAINNFITCLPKPQSQMAEAILKDPYNFGFLTLEGDYREYELEQGLIDHIQKFLMELGEGFAFVKRQYHLTVDDEDYYIDLLFYHLKLRCYFVVELKNTAFKPEYAGKLNFYLTAVDKLLRHKYDQPTIGLLLCKTKKNFTVEYALQDLNKPIGVAGYKTMLVENLPKELRHALPTVAEIEAELEKQELLAPAKQNVQKRKK